MWCGCFCCLQTFAAEEVVDWADDGETPLCPYCGIDAVLLGETDLATLWTLRNRRFGRAPLGSMPGSSAISHQQSTTAPLSIPDEDDDPTGRD